MITDEDFIDFKCPSCGEAASFPQADVGLVRACPACIQDLVVPAPGSEVGRKLPLPVTTPRLVLRRFRAGDWKDLLEMMPEAGEDHVLQWVERDSHVRLTSPDQAFQLGIELKDGAKLIGYLTLRFTEAERRQASFDMTLNESYRRKGFGREAVEGLLEFCFEGIKLHRLIASFEAGNAAAVRLCETAGLRREGESVKDLWTADGWVNTVWYAALDEDYVPGEK